MRLNFKMLKGFFIKQLIHLIIIILILDYLLNSLISGDVGAERDVEQFLLELCDPPMADQADKMTAYTFK